jgi:hypothetical protein
MLSEGHLIQTCYEGQKVQGFRRRSNHLRSIILVDNPVFQRKSNVGTSIRADPAFTRTNIWPSRWNQQFWRVSRTDLVVAMP